MKLFLILFFMTAIAQAQSTTASTDTPTTENTQLRKKVTAPRVVNQESYFQFGPRLLLWQESIPANRPGQNEKLDSQFQGISLAATYRKPTSHIRWVQSHGLELSFGRIIAKSIGSQITDTLKDQMWYALTFSPGFGYRTTSVSEIGISIPLVYRVIDWTTKDPTLKIDRDSSFSYGISGIYINQFSKQSSLQITLTNHIAWSAFAWSIGWNHRFF